MRRYPALVTLMILIGPSLLAMSCSTPPKSYRESDMTTPEARKQAAGLYWQRIDVPLMGAGQQAKVAIADFTVEFVTASREANASTVPAGEEEKPTAVAARLATMAPKQVLFPPESLQEIANALYTTFADELTRKGRIVLPVETVLSSKAYSHLLTIGTAPQRVTVDESRRDDPDLGYPTTLTVVPAKGLSIAKGTTGISTTDLAISALQETGADAVIRVRLRVNVFRGRACIERGTQIWVTRPQGRGTLTLQKPLLSDNAVLVDDAYRGLRPNEYRVDPKLYQATTQRLLTTAIVLAMEAANQ